METTIHAIGDRNFSFEIKQTGGDGAPYIDITVGDGSYPSSKVTIFFHGGKVDRALLDIDTAIRAFLDNRK